MNISKHIQYYNLDEDLAAAIDNADEYIRIATICKNCLASLGSFYYFTKMLDTIVSEFIEYVGNKDMSKEDIISTFKEFLGAFGYIKR